MKASAAGPVIAWGGSGRVAWSPRDIPSLTRAGFQGNPVGFRSVKLIAEAAAALPVVLQACAAAVRRAIRGWGLFASPNAAQGRAESVRGDLRAASPDGECLCRGGGRPAVCRWSFTFCARTG